MTVIKDFTQDLLPKSSINNKKRNNNNISLVLSAVQMSKSTYYYKKSEQKPAKNILGYSYKNDGDIITDKEIKSIIIKLLENEFVDYGYIKVCHFLKQQGIIINKKKVYRLMKEMKLLKKKNIKPVFKRNFVKYRKIKPDRPLQYLETDIKYIYIPNERLNVYLLTIIDVFSRKVLAYKLAKSIKNNELITLIDSILDQYKITEGMTLRNDNGSQFIANNVRDYLKEKNIYQEFTHFSTPQENAHIEAFHSIIQREFVDKTEYLSFNELTCLYDRYCRFYNEDRIHSGIGYKSPNHYISMYLDNNCSVKDFDLLKLTLSTNFIKF